MLFGVNFNIDQNNNWSNEMIEKYSDHEFEIYKFTGKAGTCLGGQILYRYEIYTGRDEHYKNSVIESDDYYESKQKARFAAIGHINLLENGEHNDERLHNTSRAVEL